MATQQQYEYFKFKYKEEDDRNALLTKRAEIYLSIISLVFTGLIFKISDIKSYCEKNITFLIAFCLLLGSLLISVWFILQSIRLRDYQQDMDVANYIEELGDTQPTDSDFFDNRIAQFISATPQNFEINNNKADQLKSAGRFLFLSFILLSIFIIAIITL